MSNALFRALGLTAETSASASAPATQEAVKIGLTPLTGVLAAMGLCVLVVYTVTRCIRPGKLRLEGAPGRHNHVTLAHVVVLYVLLVLIQAAAAYTLGPTLGEKSVELGVACVTIGQVVWLPACLWVAWKCFPPGLARGLGLSGRHWLFDGLRAGVAYLAVLPVCLGLWWLFAMLGEMVGRPPQPNEMLELLKRAPFGWRILTVFSAGVMAPLAEEVFFRGLFQSALRRYSASPWPAVIGASVFFAASHVANPHTIPAMLALGLVLGYNYERTGRLVTPILIHFLFNAVSLADTMLYA